MNFGIVIGHSTQISEISEISFINMYNRPVILGTATGCLPCWDGYSLLKIQAIPDHIPYPSPGVQDLNS